jgi:hypothetical protein
MPAYASPKLEFSRDPLSDSTPTWIDISAFLIEASWSSGITKDLDAPEAGHATFRLKNTGRRFEPEYAAGAYFPDIVPLRRFRWSVVADGTTYQQGIWLAQSWQVVYPNAGSTYSEVVVSCTDQTAVLSLAALPSLDPPSAETYSDVVAFDNPLGHWPLDEAIGKALSAAAGPTGQYKNAVTHLTGASPVLGEAGYAARFDSNGYAKVPLEDSGVFHDSLQVTAEVVINKLGDPTSINRYLILGPYDTPAAGHTWGIWLDNTPTINAFVATAGASVVSTSATSPANGTHHITMTFDGGAITLYVDGVQVAQRQGVDNILDPDSSEAVYIGGSNHVAATNDPGIILSHAAVYDYALGADRVAAHATAALARGYAQDTAGDRIAALATNPLWSTASIPAGQITVIPRMQAGQTILDEILTTVQAETPLGLFFFNDNGDPEYVPWDATQTIAATLGEAEVQYDSIDLQYDDEVFNQSTVSRDGGLAQTVDDTASQSAYGVRAHDETGLILAFDDDARLIAQTIVDRFADPMYRFETITLNGAAQNRRTQILAREIGDTIRIKRRGEGGTANPDIVCRILGKQKTLDVARNLSCAWNVSRGFPATPTVARLGVTGYDELGSGFILG